MCGDQERCRCERPDTLSRLSHEVVEHEPGQQESGHSQTAEYQHAKVLVLPAAEAEGNGRGGNDEQQHRFVEALASEPARKSGADHE